MRGALWLAAGLVLASCGASGAEERPREPVVGLPCEGCGDVFPGMPGTLASAARIAPEDEPGEPMVLEGVVRDASGSPASGVIVYAYHTDDHGRYPPEEAVAGRPATRHGRLRGWALSDAEGRYRFDTIRPAGYPDTRIPAHVHMHVIEPGRCTYYIADVHFTDDPRLGDADRAREAEGRGGSGLITPARNGDRVWIVQRDIVLGRNVPGYPER